MPEFDAELWPPLGLFLLMPTFIDREVADREQVVFPAGKPGTLVCLQTEELFRDDPVVITALTAETIAPEPVGTRRGNLWAVRADRAGHQRRPIAVRPWTSGDGRARACRWAATPYRRSGISHQDRSPASAPGLRVSGVGSRRGWVSGEVAGEPLVPAPAPPFLAVFADA